MLMAHKRDDAVRYAEQAKALVITISANNRELWESSDFCAYKSFYKTHHLTRASPYSLRAHACFGLLIKTQVNALPSLLSSHGLHTPPHS